MTEREIRREEIYCCTVSKLGKPARPSRLRSLHKSTRSLRRVRIGKRLCFPLCLARALAQDAQVLILTEPLNSVDEPSQRYIYDAMETQVGSDRLPVGYPGLLQDLEQVYVVSTTAETTRRMERDGYPETAQSETAQTETTQNQEVN